MEAATIGKILLVLIIIYLALAILNVILYGWEGFLPFLTNPIITLSGAKDGVLRYIASKT